MGLGRYFLLHDVRNVFPYMKDSLETHGDSKPELLTLLINLGTKLITRLLFCHQNQVTTFKSINNVTKEATHSFNVKTGQTSWA